MKDRACSRMAEKLLSELTKPSTWDGDDARASDLNVTRTGAHVPEVIAGSWCSKVPCCTEQLANF